MEEGALECTCACGAELIAAALKLRNARRQCTEAGEGGKGKPICERDRKAPRKGEKLKVMRRGRAKEAGEESAKEKRKEKRGNDFDVGEA